VRHFLATLTLMVTLPFVSSAHAGLIFVGFWDVADPGAPIWSDSSPDGPLAYTAQEAAALVFGGNAAHYTISTVDDTVANINYMAWYDVIGFGGSVFAQDYSNKYLGQYYGPTNSYVPGNQGNSASAFVRDSLTQGVERNYAFKLDGIIDPDPDPIPAPSVLSLFLVGLMGFALSRRRIKVNVAS
jgi:hypothetical protein